MQALSLLEVLFMKSSSWHKKQQVQKWLAVLMKQIANYFPNYKIKPQIASKNRHNAQIDQDINFFGHFMHKISKSNNTQLMIACISFLRVFVINQLQNQSRQFVFVDKNQNLQNQPWFMINDSLIRIKVSLNNLKKQEICISLCYWLCNNKSEFIKQCIKKGIINILSQSLKHKDISQWYGKKIINFLKLLLLAFRDSQQNLTNLSIPEFQNCLAKFTMKYDSQQIMRQVRTLFTYLNKSVGKIQKQQSSFNKYAQHSKNVKQKTDKERQKLLMDTVINTRILVLYGEDESLKKQLQKNENYGPLLKTASNKDQELLLLNEIWNLLAYSFKAASQVTAPSLKVILETLSSILTSSKHKNTLNANKKKLLISFIRMLRQLFEDKQNRQACRQNIMKYGIIKKLYKFSDCTNFRYERELLSLQNLLNMKASKQESSEDTSQIMKAFSKHLQESASNKFSKKSYEDQLQEVRLFYEMVCSQEKIASNIDNQTVKAISKKLYINNNQTQSPVQVNILDSSDTERSKQIVEQINYYTAASLKQVQQKNQQNKAKSVDIDEQELIKLLKIGSDPNTKKQTIKSIADYLQKLIQRGGIPDKYIQEAYKIINRDQTQIIQSIPQQQSIIIKEQTPKTEQILCRIRQKQLHPRELAYLMRQQEQQQNFNQLVDLYQKQVIFNNLQDAYNLLAQSELEHSQKSQSNILIFLMMFQSYCNKKSILKLLHNKKIKALQFYRKIGKLLQKSECTNENKNIHNYIKVIRKLIYNIFRLVLRDWIHYQNLSKLFPNQIHAYTDYIDYQELQEIRIEGWKSLFSQILKISYKDIIKQSIHYTDSALQILSYNTQQCLQIRQQKLISLIYTNPQNINRQLSFIINTGQILPHKRFWQLHNQSIQKQLGQSNILTKHFLQTHFQKMSNGEYKNNNLESYILQIYQQLQQMNKDILGKLSRYKTSDELHNNKNDTQNIIRKCIQNMKLLKVYLTNQSIQHNLGICKNVFNSNRQLLIQSKSFIDHQSMGKRLKYNWLIYIIFCLETMKYCLKNRKLYQQIANGQQTNLLAGLKQVYKAILSYKNAKINQQCLQIIRIFVLLAQEDCWRQVIQQLYKYNYAQLLLLSQQNVPKLTQKAQQHRQSIENIIDAFQHNNLKQIKNQYFKYFFGELPPEPDQIAQISFTDQEFLKHLKNLLHPPYQFGIIQLSKHFRTINSRQASDTYIKVFNLTDQLFMNQIQKQQTKDTRKSMRTIPASVTSIEQGIVQNIWGAGIELNPQFYAMIKKNIIGLSVCLKTKGIGEYGIRIVCEKVFQYTDELALCAYILHLNAQNIKQWDIVYESQILKLVNKEYAHNKNSAQFIERVSYFIGSSSVHKKIQQSYRIQQLLYQYMIFYEEDVQRLVSIIYALSGIVYLNEGNQRLLGSSQKIQKYLKILTMYILHDKRNQIFQKMCLLLSNLVYKNLHLISIYLQKSVHTLTFKIFISLQAYQFGVYKQFLRLIGNMTLTLEGATYIGLHTPFLQSIQTIANHSIHNNHPEIIKYLLEIIFYMLNYHEIQIKNIAYRIHELKCTNTILKFLKMFSQDKDIATAGLDALDRIFIVQANRQQALKQKTVLNWMQQLAIIHVWDETIFRKWLKLLIQISKPDCIQSILQSQVLLKLASLINYHKQSCDKNLLDVLLSLSNEYCKKCQNKRKYVSSGLLDLLCELLTFSFLKAEPASMILDQFLNLHISKSLNPTSYTKIFQALISRLSIQYKQENSLKIINLLIKIRDKILITTHSAMVLLQFGYMYLTQKQILLSAKYHKRVREFVSLLAYFIAFNVQLKIIFSHQNQKGFIDILESWIKIDKSLEEDNSIAEACRICIFVINNDQRFLIDVTEQMRVNQQILINKLNKKHKCLLYRRNHTNKNAIVRLKNENDQEFKKTKPKQNNKVRDLIAYKAPDGQIKQKYTLPLTNVISFRSDFIEEDKCFKDSVFNVPGGIFQKSANAKNCITIIGIVGEQLSIRQMDIEFGNKKQKQQFVQDFKYAVSIQFKFYKSDL